MVRTQAIFNKYTRSRVDKGIRLWTRYKYSFEIFFKTTWQTEESTVLQGRRLFFKLYIFI